jgi:ABC-2 type transport system permease protein
MNTTWASLAARRELVWELVWSELRGQVAGKRLGWLWWLIDPLLMMAIYWAVVVALLGRGREAYSPYPVFLLCALIPWKHVSRAAQRSTAVLRRREGLIRSVPFPTGILPLAEALSGFLLSLGGFAVVAAASLAFAGSHHSGRLLPWAQVPLLMAFQLAAVGGLCLALAPLGVRFRDLESGVAHALRVGFYLSPGLFGLDLVHRELVARLGEAIGTAAWSVYLLNPFALVIHGYRNAFFYGRFLDPAFWALLAGTSLGLLLLGYAVYRRHDDRLVKLL